MTDKRDEALKLAQDLKEFAQRFEDGDWSEAINVTHQEIKLLKDAARALAEQPAIKQDLTPEQPAQQPVAWMDAEGDVYKTEPPEGWCPPHTPLYTSPQPAQQQEPTCQQNLQVWVISNGKGKGQFSWEPQDERYWTRMEPAVKQSLTVEQPAQPSKPWVGLTEEEVDECYYWKGRQWTTDELVRHVEAKLREKNNG